MTIAKNILQIVAGELAKWPDTQLVRQVQFKTGKMNAIIPESLTFCFDIIKKEIPALASAELSITELPLIVLCRHCQQQAELDEPLFICPQCGHFDLEIVSGTEMFVESIEIDEPQIHVEQENT